MNILQKIAAFFSALFGGGKSKNGQAPSRPVVQSPSKPQAIPAPKAEPPPVPPATSGAPAAEPSSAPSSPPASAAADQPLANLPLKISEVQSRGKTYLEITDGRVEARFQPYKKGLFTYGRQRAVDFIRDHREALRPLRLSESVINVMRPVSENEGNLDAINTWDNSFLTFGMFQWTIGAGDQAGELPALLKKIKDADPDLFHRCFGRYGLDIAGDTGRVYGHLTLDGTPVVAGSRKEAFRRPEWAYRFWRAGQETAVQAVEIEHAASRLKSFYWKPRYSIEGHPMAEVITSEYGVALILDNHVNRPGYVDNCLRLAVKEVGPGQPGDWTDEEEQRVIDAYLQIRESYGKYPMTHAAKRAAVTRRYADEGLLSTRRGSFVYDPDLSSRSGDPASLIGIPPGDYDERQYDDIRHFDEQVDQSALEPPDAAQPD